MSGHHETPSGTGPRTSLSLLKLALWLTLLPLATGAPTLADSRHRGDAPRRPDLVQSPFFVSDIATFFQPGCDAVTVLDPMAGGEPYFSIARHSPGRLATDSTGSTVISIPQGHGGLIVVKRTSEPGAHWESFLVAQTPDGRQNPARWGSAVEISPDDSNLVIATMDGWLSYPLDPIRQGRLPAPTVRFEAPIAQRMLPGDLEFSANGETLYVLGSDGFLYVQDPKTGMERRPRIPYPVPRYRYPRVPTNLFTYGLLSPDERHFIINTGDGAGNLTVIDLISGTAWSAPLTGLTEVWDIAFDHSHREASILAAHGENKVAIYRFDSHQPQLLAQATVKSGIDPLYKEWAGPMGVLGWSVDGTRLLVSQHDRQGGKEWVLFRIEQGPSWAMPVEMALDSCTWTRSDPPGGSSGDPYVFPEDIISLNGRNRPTLTSTIAPSQTSTPTPIPTLSPTPSPSPTPSATNSPSSTAIATPSPTSTSTSAPAPAFLPLLLRERCLPEQRRVDVVLVLDASLSMLEPAGGDAPPAASRSKLDAARDAARALLDALRLDRGDQAAVVGFNSAATLQSPLTADRAALDRALAVIVPAAGTCIVCAVEAAAAELAPARRQAGHAPVLVLLTDGRSNPQPAAEAVAGAAAAKATGIRVYTVGLGADLDEAALREMASGPDAYRHAPSAAELVAIYRAIAVDIPCPTDTFWAGR